MEPRAEFFPVPFPSCTPFIMSEACCGGKDALWKTEGGRAISYALFLIALSLMSTSVPLSEEMCFLGMCLIVTKTVGLLA